MPTPGPRSQWGPDAGYRNPGGESPDRINHWDRPGPVFWPGRSPGTMFVTLRGNVLGAGQIRKLWKQAVDYIPVTTYSWTKNGAIGAGSFPVGQITRATRYLTRSLYLGAGVDHSRFDAMHTKVVKRNTYKTVTVNAGAVRNRPTVRNRLSSFGSRVPTLNTPVSAAMDQQGG